MSVGTLELITIFDHTIKVLFGNLSHAEPMHNAFPKIENENVFILSFDLISH